MNIFDAIKTEIKNIFRTKKLNDDPNDKRYTFISDDEKLRLAKINEYRVFYIGESSELMNYYLNEELYGFVDEPIYNANRRQHFWALSEHECNIKRIHSNIPRASVNCLVDIVGDVKIKADGLAWDGTPLQDKVDKILEDNNFTTMLNQQIRPLVLVEGYGALKPAFDDIRKTPIIQFYEGKDIEIIQNMGIINGIVYKDYYEYNGKKYMLLDIRHVSENKTVVEYKLYRLKRGNDCVKVELSEVPELAGLKGYELDNVNEILGTYIKYLHDPLNFLYGKSVFAGKIDIADELDMILSVESETIKNSSPVEYYPVDLLKRGKNGGAELPAVFGRRYVKKPSLPNANGDADNKIDISAPALDFSKYEDALIDKTQLFLSGFLSPSSFGINVARNDNALAQREKEKTTIMTRNNVMAMESKAIVSFIKVLLMYYEFQEKGTVSTKDYDISCEYQEFANPSFETQVATLLPLFNSGAISPKLFVDKLYGKNLTEEEKTELIEWITKRQQEDILNFDENGIRSTNPDDSI